MMRSIDPASEQVVEERPWMTNDEVEGTLASAERAAERWRRTTMSERSAAMMRAAELLRSDDELARSITAEMGKPITEAEAEVAKCAFGCEWYAENAHRFVEAEPTPSDTPNSTIVFEPLGILLAIMPWNFPAWQVFRHAAPALMAGNTVCVKPAPGVPRTARLLETLMAEAGFPQGCLANLYIDVPAIERVIADHRIAAVTLTGSDRAGSSVAEIAGKHLKKTVLELGGSDAFVVLDDADLVAAAETAIKARFMNTGQSCIAAKRFILHGSIAEEFTEMLVKGAAALVVGDPAERATEIGPLARADLRDNLARQVRASVEQGAVVSTGGEPLDRKGFFYQPTVIRGVTPGMPVGAEETFGPVAAVMTAEDDERLVELANASQYGLGGNVWSGDLDRAAGIAAKLRTGGVFINGMTHSDPRLPFGGIKRSGYGRELSGYGIREFVNIKTIWRP